MTIGNKEPQEFWVSGRVEKNPYSTFKDFDYYLEKYNEWMGYVLSLTEIVELSPNENRYAKLLDTYKSWTKEIEQWAKERNIKIIEHPGRDPSSLYHYTTEGGYKEKVKIVSQRWEFIPPKPVEVDLYGNEKSQKIKPKGKGGRPKDPNRRKELNNLQKRYYHLTGNGGLTRKGALDILEKEYDGRWRRGTIINNLKK